MQPRIGPRIALAALVCTGLIAGTVWLAQVTPRSGVDAVAPSASSEVVPAALLARSAVPLSEAESARRAPASAASEPSAPTSMDLVLVLIDADEAPLADVELLLVDADEDLQRATTDAEGRALFEPCAGSGEVYFQVPAFMPQRRELELTSGERRIALEPGAEVSGWVTVRGEAPEDSLELTLTSQYAIFGGRALLDEVLEFLGLEGRRSSVVRCSTDAQGAFAFRGLEADWSGAIEIPEEEDYELRSGAPGHFATRVTLHQPQRGLELQVERRPRLTGRVRASDGSALEGRTIVECRLESGEGPFWSSSFPCGDDGSFEVALERRRLRKLVLDVSSPSGRTSLERTDVEIGDGLDLGDILLAPGQGLTFRVLDPDGAPIAGALGWAGEYDWMATTDTDTDGLGSLHGLTPGRTRLTVGAPGYAAAQIEVVVPTPEPVALTLTPTNRLSIVLESNSEPAANALWLLLESDSAPLFPETGGAFPGEIGEATGSSWEQHGAQPAFEPDEEGRIELQDLAVGVSLKVIVQDSLGTELLTQALAPLSREEHREVVLHVSRRDRRVAGTVRDAQGNPLSGASVRLSDTDGETWHLNGEMWQLSDANGWFSFEAVSPERVDLDAYLQGYSKAEHRDVALMGARTHVDFVLERGRTATILVIDEHGCIVDGGRVGATLEGGNAVWAADAAGAGRHELNDIPGDGLTLDLHLGGRRYTGHLEPDAPTAGIRVPAHGSLRVSGTLPEGLAPEGYCARVQSADGVELFEELRRSGRNVVEFPAILPGTYDVVLGRRASEHGFEPLSQPRTVVIEAHAAASVTLHL